MEIRALNEQLIIDAFTKQIPYMQRWATARTLTTLARLGRGLIPEIIDRHMTLRTRSFVSKSTRYEAAKGSQAIDRQVARFGTVAIERATGWIEQPKGGPDRRKRKWTKKARRGGTGKVAQKLRFKPGNKKLFLSSVKGRQLGNVYRAMAEDESLYGAPVNVSKNDYGIYPGVIKFNRKKFKWTNPKTKKEKTYRVFVRVASRKDKSVRQVDMLGLVFKEIMKRDPQLVYEYEFIRQLERLKTG